MPLKLSLKSKVGKKPLKRVSNEILGHHEVDEALEKVESLVSYDHKQLSEKEEKKALVITRPQLATQKKEDHVAESPVHGLVKPAGVPTSEEKAPVFTKAGIKNVTEGQETTDKSYEKVPIEDFGKAFLRGLGWNEQEDSTSQEINDGIIKNSQRSVYLGIGAKEIPAMKSKRKVKYSPVVLKDKATGKIVGPEVQQAKGRGQ